MWKSTCWDVKIEVDVEIDMLMWKVGCRHVGMWKSTGWDVEIDMLGCRSRQVGMWKSTGWDV